LEDKLSDVAKGKLKEVRFADPDGNLFQQISGDNQDKFHENSAVLLNNINHFSNTHEIIPNIDLKIGMYNSIRGRLLALSALSPLLYENLISNEEINTKIDNFIELENIINPQEVPQDNNSDTYGEVANATLEEQEI
jgi:hypothetical protein